MALNKKWFLDKINDFLRNNKANRMKGVDGILMFEPDVLVGFASGNDPIFNLYKKAVGPFHLTPEEAYLKYCEKNNIIPTKGILTVVAFIFPLNQITKKQHSEYSDKWPCERWAHTRLYGEECNLSLQIHLLDELKKEFGINGVAPMAEDYLNKLHKNHPNALYAYPWSHRHMAYASGLGSFGLSDGFLNEKGIAMRCGSIVIDHELPSDAEKRPSNHYEYCTNCGACIKRCPAGAISFEKRHDKKACREYVMATTPYIQEHFNIPIYSCGLCFVKVPCQDKLPIKNKKKARICYK
ncbi:MAG: 4Fe-4S binding protein [Promethearchaeota archaeon]